MKVKTKNLFTTKELIEQLIKIAEEPNSVSQGWYQIVMSEAKQFLKMTVALIVFVKIAQKIVELRNLD